VFFHGILGSRETWRNSAETDYWPTMLAADPDIKERIEVFRVDYDSFLFSSGPAMVDVSKAVADKLDTLFKRQKYRRAFLIGHSLGGNVARQYLLHVNNRYGHRALSTFRLVFTLGTPMEGSSLATIARLASANQQLRVLQPIRVNDFQQLLNATMDDLTAKHRGVCPSLRVLSAFETKPVAVVGIVVSKESATKYADESLGFDRDHFGLAKPADRNDSLYLWVKDNLLACTAERQPCDGSMTPNCAPLLGGWPDPSR